VDEIDVPTSAAPTRSPVHGESADADPLRIATRGAVRILTLDLAPQRDALDDAMIVALAAVVPQIARDTNIYAIVLRSSGRRMFCAGADVREWARLAVAAPAQGVEAIQAQYRLVWLLECLSKPVVSLINGAVMGAGAGITLVNTHRVAAGGYAFACPEVQLGFFPDAGVSYALGRLPGEIGTYLALTGRPIERADAFALGLVTHCIDVGHFDEIERQLADAQTVDPLLDSLHQPPAVGALVPYQPYIADCFAGDTVPEIGRRLVCLADSAAEGSARAWATDVLADLLRASPLSLAVALRHLRLSRAMDLRQTLTIDGRLVPRMFRLHDFQEGVRARFVDQDNAPRWQPATLAEVSAGYIEDLFRADEQHEIFLPTRAEMQAARV
jgi:enoyl-CoA hydratase